MSDDREILKAQQRRARHLDDLHLLCRLVGHRWDRVLPDREPLFGRLVCWECGSCGTVRDDIVDPQFGRLLARSYRYPSGYQLKRNTNERGGRLLSSQALRTELLRRDTLLGNAGLRERTPR